MVTTKIFTAKRILTSCIIIFLSAVIVRVPAQGLELPAGIRAMPVSQLALAQESLAYQSRVFRNDFASFGLAQGKDEFSDDSFSDDNTFTDVGASNGSSGRHHYSVLGAVGLSALLPGAGHWYIGNRRGARLFLGAEAGIWAAFAALKVNAGWKQDDVERFATRHAGVSGLGRDKQFFRQLTFYSSREEYNSLGRAFDPDLPFIADTPGNDWNWDSVDSRRQFRQLFNDQNSADRNADFMFIAAIVNRLTSAVLAWRSTQKLNNQLDEDDTEFGSRNHRKTRYAYERRTTFRLVKPAPGSNASDGLMLSVSHLF